MIPRSRPSPIKDGVMAGRFRRHTKYAIRNKQQVVLTMIDQSYALGSSPYIALLSKLDLNRSRQVYRSPHMHAMDLVVRTGIDSTA